MKKTTSTLFLALILTITVTSISAQDGGQIPIAGRTTAVNVISETNKSTASRINAPIEADTAVEARIEFSSEISDYLQTFISIVRQFRF